MIWHLLLVVILSQVVYSVVDIWDLKGASEFRSIQLQWKARSLDSRPQWGFKLSFCEQQTWGAHRCRVKTFPNANDIQIRHDKDRLNREYGIYGTKIEGLRLATNYTVHVTPTAGDDAKPLPQRARALGGDLVVRTKEFYAKAINCLANASRVQFVTGPFFGGQISVEGSTDKRCSIQGDSSGDRTSYLLTIDHALCGSIMNVTSVKSFIIVQENLPILTHSTRRFMVVCKYVPETFTVRAGVNLPDDEEEINLVPVGNDVFEVDPSELFDSTGTIFNSRVAKQAGRAMKFSADKEDEDSQKWTHFGLMVVLILTSVLGISFTIFHFVKQSRMKNRTGFLSPQVEPSAIEENDSLEAVVRDFGDSRVGSSDTSVPAQPVSLTGINFDYGSVSNISFRCSTAPQLIGSNPQSPEFVDEFPNKNSEIAVNDFCELKNQNGFTNTSVHSEDSLKHSEVPFDSMTTFIPENHHNAVSTKHLENIDAVFETALSIFPDCSEQEAKKDCGNCGISSKVITSQSLDNENERNASIEPSMGIDELKTEKNNDIQENSDIYADQILKTERSDSLLKITRV